MSNETDKEEFTRKLRGEPVNWKAYAMYQINNLIAAEEREKERDENSRYFMDLEKAIHTDMELTQEQIDSIGELYIQWVTDKGLI
jgi:hypothetical protein